MHKDFEPTSLDPHSASAAPRAPAGLLRTVLERLGLAPSGNRDRQTALYSRQGLLDRGDRLVERAGSDSALVLFAFHDLLEVPDLYGTNAAGALQAALVERLVRLAGRPGLAARTGPAEFAVLLPATGRDAAVDATLRVFGKPCRLELDLDHEEVVLVPDVAVETVENDAGELRSVYGQLSVRLARHRDHEQRRRTSIRRERERHSRPMPLDPQRSEDDLVLS